MTDDPTHNIIYLSLVDWWSLVNTGQLPLQSLHVVSSRASVYLRVICNYQCCVDYCWRLDVTFFLIDDVRSYEGLTLSSSQGWGNSAAPYHFGVTEVQMSGKPWKIMFLAFF